MGIFDKLKSFKELKKDKDKKSVVTKNIFDKRRGKKKIVDFRCSHCGHDKAWDNGKILRCTKCHELVVI